MAPLQLLLLLALGWIAAPDPSLENQLRQEYVGSQRMLRHFSAADKLKFDLSGEPLNREPSASWTIAGAVVIEKLTLNGQNLEMQGHRRLVTFDNEHRQLTYVKSNKTLSIEVITSDGPNQASQLHSALAKIFAEQNELPSLLPDYWRDYLARFSGNKSGGCESGAQTAGTPAVSSEPAALPPDEISEGQLIKKVEPHYLPAARKAGIEGEVQLGGLIGKTGSVTNICIVKALGAGLDDSGIDAVRQWRYKPYLQNGNPIEVETTISITFRK